MQQNFDFNDLFVLDLANNHQGSLDHGLNVIKAHGEVVRRHGIRAALKFQFRQLDSFIHPSHQQGSSNKHIPRFLSTRLSSEDYRTLAAEVAAQGMLPMATPFDEESVELIERLAIPLIKVASCSAKDWPLLDAVSKVGKPIVISTGGLRTEEIDNLVSFFTHRGNDFALMHCVSVYPTPPEACQLNQIGQLSTRFPGIAIGWSTHEAPSDTDPVLVAYAKGAKMFERHIGLETNDNKLNAYSSTPEQTDAWLRSYAKAKSLCGEQTRLPALAEELSSLQSLERGVYARRPVEAQTVLVRDDVYFAMPICEGQLSSGLWRDGMLSNCDLTSDGALMVKDLTIPPQPEHQVLKNAIHDVKAMLNEAKIVLSPDFSVEYSHHYGIPKFREVGAVLITCINRAYCKKLIVQLPGQSHPKHFHKLKEETFQILSGTLHIEMEGHRRFLMPGDTQVVLPGVWHRFWTDGGAIFEEISTTQYDNDSVYADPEINRLASAQRKTQVDHWGRYQIGSTDPESMP